MNLRKIASKLQSAALIWALPFTFALARQPAAESVETIVIVRHGEKPAAGLGLLTCKGLNRALQLPGYFARNFPGPDFIFAPDPSVKTTEIHGDGQRYDYVRPLLTIGPTAISTGVPINTQFPYNDPGLLADELLSEKYWNSTVYVAWEHLNIVILAEVIVNRLDVSTAVPEWDNSNYDTVFVFTIRRSATTTETTLVSLAEDLGPLSDECPGATVR